MSKLNLAVSLVLTALLIAACTREVTMSPSPTAIPNQRVLTVSGHGEARAAPDMSTISAGVRTQAATAADALGANTTAMNRVFDAMKKLGIADKDMQTSNFSVQPIYEQLPDGQVRNEPARIIGYQVFNQVTVIVRDLKELGTALDAFVTAGANELYGVGFDIANHDPLLDEAREAAVKDAMHKADIMTKAAGVKLGKLVGMTESSNPQPVPMYQARAMAAEKSVPTAAGEQVLSADATLTYEIN